MTPPEINPCGASALEAMEDKAIPAQEGTKVLANDESDEEEEEKDLGIVGIRGEENARSAREDESQTKLMTLDTTGERPETPISKVTVKTVDSKETENESEEHKLIKPTPVEVIEVTKMKGQSEKFSTVHKEKGSASETAEIKEPQKNVTVPEKAMSSGKEVITTQETEKPGHSSTLTENQTTAATESTKATENIVDKMEKLSKEEVSVPKDGSDELSSKINIAKMSLFVMFITFSLLFSGLCLLMVLFYIFERENFQFKVNFTRHQPPAEKSCGRLYCVIKSRMTT